MTTPLETLVERWCNGGPVSVTGSGALTLRLAEGGTLSIDLRSVTDAEAELHAAWTAPAALASQRGPLEGLAQAAALLRDGLLRCVVDGGGVDIVMPLYLDGLTRHDFLSAVAEVGRAHWTLDSSVKEWEAQRAAIERNERTLAQLDAEIAESERKAREIAAGGARPAASSPSPAAAQPAAGPWAPTHVVPAGGLPAWATPDPSAPQAAKLEAGVELQVTEQRGDWAHVVATNGWSGWVDARRLQRRA
jgi:hypothetical protein